MITFTYKGKIININDIHLFLLTNFTFSLIIFIWYILYKIGIFTYFSPLLGLILTFIQNIIILGYFFYLKKITLNNYLEYFLIMVIFKILPIISFYPDQFIIKIKDIFAIIYLYIFYIFFIIIVITIYKDKYDIKNLINNDITGKNMEDTANYKLYHNLISHII